MHVQDLKDYVVRPVLKELSEFIPYTLSAENLVLGTGAQESRFWWLDQTTPGPGPAYGIYQMERLSHDSHRAWVMQHPKFHQFVQAFQIQHLDDCSEMIGNLYYATIMCRVHYWRVPATLPPANDVAAMAKYWKKYYNTYLGKGTEQEFIDNYELRVRPLR